MAGRLVDRWTMSNYKQLLRARILARRARLMAILMAKLDAAMAKGSIGPQ